METHEENRKKGSVSGRGGQKKSKFKSFDRDEVFYYFNMAVLFLSYLLESFDRICCLIELWIPCKYSS